MQRLSPPIILCYLCISHLLILQAFADEAGSPVPAVCNNTTQCANLNSITSPFGTELPCAESESFLISNCSSGQAYWDGFQKAISDDNLGAPALLGIYTYEVNYSYINLTWNTALLQVEECKMLSAKTDIDSFVPDVINLTAFANGWFQFSYFNIYLLLNCSNLESIKPNVHVDSPICKSYQQHCNVSEHMSCAQLFPFQVLTFHQTLDSMSCTHFLSFVTTDPVVPQWSGMGMIQLYGGGDHQCEHCFDSGGLCNYNPTNHSFDHCACGNNKISTTCHAHCKRFSCNTAAQIVTGVAAAVVATVICMMLLLWFYNRKRGYSTKSFPSSSSNRLLTQRAYMLSKKFGPVPAKEFSFETLSKATKSFADENMIGDGGFGVVYLGILRDGRKVAIKRLYHDNFRRMDHFYNEIKILSTLDHPRLVKLYGFCCQDSNDLLLVFEYASNGTISDQLHDATKPAMPWRTRLTIAQETAEALAYLHTSVSPPIYHRDVKTTNILLDDNLHAKLADFGLSRLVPLEATHVSTAPQGTPGYLDPDYHQCYQLTDKSDVYSFGVVLVELVSAKLAVDMSRDRREINLSNLALMKIGCGAWEDLVDPRLEMKKNPDVETMVKRVVELAFMCLNAEKDQRPTMKYVADTLASMCKEFKYGFDNEVGSAFSFKMDMNGPSPASEASHLIKTKSSSKSTESGDSIPSSHWMSSNASSHVNSF